MHTEEIMPEPCDNEIFANGHSVALIDQGRGRSWHVEALISGVAKKTGTRTDWHYSGGIAHVLTLGDPQKVAEELRLIWPAFAEQHDGAQLLIGGQAFRAGVDSLPDDALGVVAII